MQKLHVLYDADCAFCRRCRVWLGQQPAFVPLTFIPLQSPELRLRFPGIEQFEPEKEIVVISDAGEVWQGAAAWVICLWALREYREWSQRLAHPGLLPLARRFCEIVSANRHRLSRWFGDSPSVEELRNRLSAGPPSCDYQGYCKDR